MKRLSYLLAVIAIPLVMGGCDLDDDGVNFHYEALTIVSAELPESFNLHQVYTIKANVIVSDDCTSVEGFDVTRASTTTRNVVAVGVVLDRENCKPLDQEVQRTFQFEVLYTDPYLFRFYNGEDADGNAKYIEVEVPVN